MNTISTPSAEQMAESLGKWLDADQHDKAPGWAEPPALSPDADEAHIECDGLIRELRDMIKDDSRDEFLGFMDITQTDISTLSDQGRLGDLHSSANTAYKHVTGLSESLWRGWNSEGRRFYSERRSAIWNVMESVKGIETGEAFTPSDPPLLDVLKKKIKKPHWADRAKGQNAVRQAVFAICSSLTESVCDKYGRWSSYTTPSGKSGRFLLYTADGCLFTLPLYCTIWGELIDQGVMHPDDRSDDAARRNGDISAWIMSEISSFFAAREHTEQAS